MPLKISPHPELVEGRTLFMQLRDNDASLFEQTVHRFTYLSVKRPS
jgi:hypothetical protein